MNKVDVLGKDVGNLENRKVLIKFLKHPASCGQGVYFELDKKKMEYKILKEYKRGVLLRRITNTGDKYNLFLTYNEIYSNDNVIMFKLVG